MWAIELEWVFVGGLLWWWVWVLVLMLEWVVGLGLFVCWFLFGR